MQEHSHLNIHEQLLIALHQLIILTLHHVIQHTKSREHMLHLFEVQFHHLLECAESPLVFALLQLQHLC